MTGTTTPRAPQQPLLTKRGAVGLALVVGILAFFLTQTRLPDVLRKLPKLEIGASARHQTAFGQLVDPATFPEALRWVAYGLNLWDATAIGMLFAVLLGAAVTAALQPEQGRLRVMLQRRGGVGAGVGGALGMPLFMCSACSAPVSLGFYRGGATVETTLGVILGSALLNPVGLLAIFTLMPPSMGVARVVFGLAALFVLVPLVARAHDRLGPGRDLGPQAQEALAPPALAGASTLSLADTWGSACRAVLVAWGRHALDFAVRLVPAMAVAGFAVGAVLQLAPPQALSDTLGAAVLAVAAVAVLGTLLQLPTLFEIPLVFGVLALGLGEAPAAALLVTAPSAGVVTFAIVRRDLGSRTPALLLAGTFAGGLAVGLGVWAL